MTNENNGHIDELDYSLDYRVLDVISTGDRYIVKGKEMYGRKSVEQLNNEARARRMTKMGYEVPLSIYPERKQTTQGKIEGMLCKYGIFEMDAHSIVEYAKIEIDNMDEYKTTWDRPADEYNEIFYSLLFALLRPYVVKWAKVKKPQAFWISFFEKKTENK